MGHASVRANDGGTPLRADEQTIASILKKKGYATGGFVASYVGPEQYAPVVAGMDYRYVQSHSLYRQLLFQALRRAEAHGSKRVHFGIGTELEKLRFGAKREKRVMYVQSRDHFQHDVLSLIAAGANLRAAS